MRRSASVSAPQSPRLAIEPLFLVSLSTDLFDYSLPAHLVAQTPTERRDESRLLVVDRAAHSVAHHTFADLPRFLRAGDILFRNNAAVLPARLHAQRPTGGQVECFLLRPTEIENTWRCLVRPGKKLPVGAIFTHASGAFRGEIIEKDAEGGAVVQFSTANNEPITAVANRLGDVPLPPYIDRPLASSDRAAERSRDLERYQTVYADRGRQVAVAAPTAGLHFTPELLADIKARGIETADVTLHVGLGTFKPIATDSIDAHPIHRELYELPASTRQKLGSPRTGRRIAVGTTTVRTIEDFLAKHRSATHGEFASDAAPYFGEADIFIYPPRKFGGIDGLITNFHQPRSTLLCLVAAFLSPGSIDGIAWLHEIYAEAIRREYRFFSYGDAMLIV